MILVPIMPSFWSLGGRPRKLQTLLLSLLSVSHSITIIDEWAFMLTHINIKGNKEPPNNCRGAFSFMTTLLECLIYSSVCPSFPRTVA